MAAYRAARSSMALRPLLSATASAPLARAPPAMVVGQAPLAMQLSQRMQQRGLDIFTETTPNPKSMKFIPEGFEVLGSGARALVFRDKFEAQSSPLATALLELDGVKEVMLASQHITVTKETLAEWEQLEEVVQKCVEAFFESGKEVVTADVNVEKVTPASFEEGSIEARIVELLEERVRPFVEQDGGDIEFDSFDKEEGTLYLQMRGSCSGCAQSHATLQEGVRNLMEHYIPEVKNIVGLQEDPEEDLPRAR